MSYFEKMRSAQVQDFPPMGTEFLIITTGKTAAATCFAGAEHTACFVGAEHSDCFAGADTQTAAETSSSPRPVSGIRYRRVR